MTLVASADQAEAGQFGEVIADRADRLAGVERQALLRREGGAPVGVCVVGEADQDGETGRRDRTAGRPGRR
nr:hypothetical protein [Micromonospora sp. CB01531]